MAPAWKMLVPLVAALLGASPVQAQTGSEHLTTPARLEGRPDAQRVSPLQARVDAALPGSTIEVPPGTYDGDLFIDRAIHLAGRGRPLLRGSGAGSVVLIRADGVTVEGFDIDGRGGGDLGRDSQTISHLQAENNMLSADGSSPMSTP